ncbi:MAG: hypothetical protein WCE75_11385 [Terracidiphilus sp.]
MSSKTSYRRTFLLAVAVITSATAAVAMSPILPVPLPPTNPKVAMSPILPVPLPPTNPKVAMSPILPVPLPPTNPHVARA